MQTDTLEKAVRITVSNIKALPDDQLFVAASDGVDVLALKELIREYERLEALLSRTRSMVVETEKHRIYAKKLKGGMNDE